MCILLQSPAIRIISYQAFRRAPNWGTSHCGKSLSEILSYHLGPLPRARFKWNMANNADMMTSSNGNIFHVTGPLCGDFTGDRWIPLTKASDAKLWCFRSICAWTNDWVNNRSAGDLRRHQAHCDGSVIFYYLTDLQKIMIKCTIYVVQVLGI